MIRMFQVKNQDSLRKLLKAGASGDLNATPAFERLQKLNPHVDFATLKPGTVLLLPDIPDLDPDSGETIAGEAFDGLAGDAAAGLKAASARVRAGFASREAERKDVGAVLKSAAIKRLMETDEVLRKQVSEADTRFKADQKEATEALAVLEAAEGALAAEIAVLGKLFK